MKSVLGITAAVMAAALNQPRPKPTPEQVEQARKARIERQIAQEAKNLDRRQKKAWCREQGKSGKQHRRWQKAQRRARREANA